MKKIRTNLPGFDPLLHGGLQIDSLTGPGDSKSSLVIVLRGKKGVYKHLFAMQLMHGIARSLGERRKSKGTNAKLEECHKSQEPNAIYYSINKTTDKLNDSYIDFLIAEWLSFMTRQSRKEKLGFAPKESENTVRDDKKMIYEILFDSKLEKSGAYEELCAERQSMVREYDSKIIDFLSDNILLYNPRTNSLHFRRPYMGDGPRNLWAVRNCDSVLDYYRKYGDQFNALKSGGVIARHFREMFIKVDFNPHLSEEEKRENAETDFGDIGNMERYSKTANVTYEKILDHMENLLNDEILKLEVEKEKNKGIWSEFESTSETSEEKDAGSKNHPMYDVLVLDGFSQFDDEHLKNLQCSHLHKVARQMARVTILVLDDREEALCDGDVIIQLKKNEDVHQEYTYHELQIVKSSFQDVANGWHQYKVQPDGIKVFPSIHFLLSKRYYMKSKPHEIGQGVFEDSFEEYLDSKLHIANGNPSDHLEVEGLFYNEYSENKQKDHSARFMKILQNHKRWGNAMKAAQKADYNQDIKEFSKKFLSEVLLADDRVPFAGGSGGLGRTNLSEDSGGSGGPNPSGGSLLCCGNSLPPEPRSIRTCNGCCDPGCGNNRPSKDVSGWNRRYPTTVIVGNPNSFKRRMAMGKAYHWARKKEHVLIVLFGKNDDTLRRQLICPALQRAACAEKTEGIKKIARWHWDDSDENMNARTESIFDQNVYKVCSNCEKYIHFFQIRMGCIAAEEIFFRLEEQISIYSNEDANTGIEKRRLHIIIDDLQRADYGFPFLGDTSLFTAALINLCHEHKAELTMLCDKHSSRTKEVCALADNVIVMDREKNDINNVSLYIEKCVNFPAPGAIMEFKICDVLNLFQCACIGNTYVTPDPPKCEDEKDLTPENTLPETDEAKTSHYSVPPGLSVDFSRISSSKFIGSMREFWRDTKNAVLRTDKAISVQLDQAKEIITKQKDKSNETPSTGSPAGDN